MNEISLVIQSVCLEAAVGIMLFLALGRLWNKDIDGKPASIVAAVFAVIGVAASITHLGKPLRAFNSLLNIGSSWMSRETLLVMLFTVCAVVYLAVTLWKPAMKTVLRVVEIVSAVIGLVLLYAMASIYNFASVPVWEGANTYIEFYSSAIILGATLYFALTYKQQGRVSGRVLGATALAALALQVVSSELHTVSLAASGSAAVAASAEILNANGALVAVKWALLFAGVGAFLLKGTRVAAPKQVAVAASGPQASAEGEAGTSSRSIAWVSACAVVAAAFIGKVLFYASMVASGIGK